METEGSKWKLDLCKEQTRLKDVRLLKFEVPQTVFGGYLRFGKIFRRLSGTQSSGYLFEESSVVAFTAAVELKDGKNSGRLKAVKKKMVWLLGQFHLITYRVVKHIQNLDGSIFAGRSWDIHSLDVRRIVEVD